MNFDNAYDSISDVETPRHVRIVGASCGAFLFCFATIQLTVALQWFDERAAILDFTGFVIGAITGYYGPRLAFVLAYGFVFFLNAMISSVIGGNDVERIQVFAFLTFIEVVFWMTKRVVYDGKIGRRRWATRCFHRSLLNTLKPVRRMRGRR